MLNIFRKAIFIFLSNKGTKEITFHLLNLWNDGLEREKTKLSHFEPLVIKGAFEEEGKYYILCCPVYFTY